MNKAKIILHQLRKIGIATISTIASLGQIVIFVGLMAGILIYINIR